MPIVNRKKRIIMRLTNTILGIVLASVFSLSANATIWRVNNNTSVDADFTTITAAYSAASAGDTLYVEGSSTAYSGNLVINKKIIIIGPGFHLDKNDSTQANQNTARINGYLNIDAGAEGTEIHGMDIEYSSSFSGTFSQCMIDIDCDSISFFRNRMYWGYTGNSTSYYMMNIDNSINNVSLIGNWMISYYSYNNCLRIGSGCTSVLVANNFIAQSRNSTTNPLDYNNSYYAIRTESNASNNITLLNNIIQGRWYSYYCTNLNNIHIGGSVTNSNSTWYNNIDYSTGIPAGNGNQQNVAYTAIFDRQINGAANWWEDDNYWKLLPAGPAVAAGVSGEDCGMFGGALKFNPSGLPAIPAIFSATIPATTDKGTGLPIDISSKSHK